MPSPFITGTDEGVLFSVNIQPRASKTENVGTHGHALKFRVAAPPVQGAANEALCEYLAERLGLPKSGVNVKTGHASRLKRILLKGISVNRVMEVFPL